MVMKFKEIRWKIFEYLVVVSKYVSYIIAVPVYAFYLIYRYVGVKRRWKKH